jgi:hypothetical protein
MMNDIDYLVLNSFSQQQNGIKAFSCNPALLMNEKKSSLGFFSERKFNLLDCSLNTMSFSKAFSNGNIGLAIKHAGNLGYQENQLGVYYSKKIVENLDIGLGFFYLSGRASSFVNSFAVSTNIGSVIHLSPKVIVGFSVFNPINYCAVERIKQRIGNKDIIGIGYNATNNFFLGLTIIKEENHPLYFVSGIQYKMNKKAHFDLGIISKSGSMYLGIGYYLKKIQIKCSFSSHPQLGLSPGLLLSSIE